MAKKRKVQKQGVCIFCGGFGLSRQHVFPDWMSRFFPVPDLKPQVTTYFSGCIQRGVDEVLLTPELMQKQHNGPMNQRKIRNVCIRCNGGWISEVESAAKPLFEKMISGEDSKISVDESRKLSLAISIMTIMAEYTNPDPSKIIIPAGHRKYIFDNRVLPEGWFISVGMNKEFCSPRPRTNHFSLGFGYKESGVVLSCGFQVTTTTIGHLLIQAATLVNFNYPVVFPTDKFFKIWPEPNPADNWKQNLTIQSYDNFLEISDSLPHLLQKFLTSKIPYMGV